MVTTNAPAIDLDKAVRLWEPFPGPQTRFSARQEDIALFGGTKGPGKTDALLYEGIRKRDNSRARSLYLRREMPRLTDAIDRSHRTFPQFGARWRSQEHRWIFPSGFTYQFGHCEHEKDKYRYQGQEFDYIAIDQCEEFTESQVEFILMQNRTSVEGIPCYARLSANPGGPGQMWVIRWFIEGKQPFQTYRREFVLPDGTVMTRTSTYIPATIYDNPAILKNNPTYLATLMDLPEEMRKAYLEGDWHAFLSDCIFDKDGLKMLQETVCKPPRTGFLRDRANEIKWFTDDQGAIEVWRMPDANGVYAMAADAAKGKVDGDYSSAVVVDVRDWSVVATFQDNTLDAHKFGDELDLLGEFYNDALLIPEVWPGPGHATGLKLQELKYPKLYRRVEYRDGEYKETPEIGWVTNERTRYEALSTLMDATRRGLWVCRSQKILDEMWNFIRNKKTGKFEAREGCTDDFVICMAILLHTLKFAGVEKQLMVGERAEKAMAPVTITPVVGGSRRNGTLHGPAWNTYRRRDL